MFSLSPDFEKTQKRLDALWEHEFIDRPLVPLTEVGRYLGISNLAGAGAGMIGSGIGGPVADSLNGVLRGLGCLTIFTSFGFQFMLSVFTTLGERGDSVAVNASA